MPATQSTDPADTRAARDGEVEPDELESNRICLTFEKIRDYSERRLFWVPCPEFGEGCGVYIPSISSKERIEFETANIKTRKRKGQTTRDADLSLFNERLFVRFACDEKGNRLFPATTRDEETRLAELMREKPASAIGRVAVKVSALIGWNPEDLEELEGN